MSPNFLSKFAFLPGESWALLTENFIDFSFDLEQTAETFWTKAGQVHSCKKFNFLVNFAILGWSYAPSFGK